ncbi:MAG TPA: PHP domain-containing protein [Solirubrobacteraceae bacterium]|nr:PHP domain-containing protein [Solirubrobacteraceae bacterium]
MIKQRFAIAHVTPYPWEAQDDEVNAHVARLAGELSGHGHRVLILAPSRSPELVRASRRELRAAKAKPESLLEGTDGGAPRVVAIGEVLDVPSSAGRRPRALPVDVARTLEELLSRTPLDFVHVHEPFAPSASSTALRYSRALNVGSFHAPTERLLSTMLARRFVESFFGRLDARIASLPETAELMARHFPGEYRVVATPGAAPLGAGGASESSATTPPPAPNAGEVMRGDGDGGDWAYSREDWDRAVTEVESIYAELAARRHDTRGDPALRRRLERRRLIDVDLHMHTDHSHDCATPVEVLLAAAREAGLGAIAVTDHNEISGALEAREKAAAAGVKVIVGEEVKTASQGEVIGLFIEEKIPRGLTLEQTVAEIKRQGGLVYVPHPFDRMHAVPDYEHLLPILDDVDAIEVFNPRVAIGAFNEEAVRFAAKYRIVAGAGSDSHVAQGLGSVRIRMRDFEGPREFLESLREAEIVTKPSSLIYVQALKFLQTRATPAGARRASRERRVRRATRGGGGRT